jgi:hypothetical protein
MSQFIEIIFEEAILAFREAEASGNRWRIGDFPTSKWLQKNHVNLDDVLDFARKFADSKIVIIGEGQHEGFYIYSEKKKTCYKFARQMAEV